MLGSQNQMAQQGQPRAEPFVASTCLYAMPLHQVTHLSGARTLTMVHAAQFHMQQWRKARKTPVLLRPLVCKN